MRVTRINTFIARDGQSAALQAHLVPLISTIRAIPGCESCQLLHHSSRSEQFVVLEMWESQEAHKASVAAIAPEAIQQTMALLAGPPSGDYYTHLDAP